MNTPKILFDTGANGLNLLSNMKKLNIDPKFIKLDFIFNKGVHSIQYFFFCPLSVSK